MKLTALFSGGKDSTFAIWKAIQEGHDIVSLIAFEPENKDSYMFHHPNINLTKIQAQAMNIALKLVKTEGVKEEELKDLEQVLSQDKEIQGVVAGALASEYQKSRVDNICKKLGLKGIAPMWKIDADEYWEQLLDNDFRVVITKVACDGLGKEWLGKEITRKNLKELKTLAEKFKFHLAFEGGEAETFVIDCPLFSQRVDILDSEIDWDGEVGVFKIKSAVLNKK